MYESVYAFFYAINQNNIYCVRILDNHRDFLFFTILFLYIFLVVFFCHAYVLVRPESIKFESIKFISENNFCDYCSCINIKIHI